MKIGAYYTLLFFLLMFIYDAFGKETAEWSIYFFSVIYGHVAVLNWSLFVETKNKYRRTIYISSCLVFVVLMLDELRYLIINKDDYFNNILNTTTFTICGITMFLVTISLFIINLWHNRSKNTCGS